MKYPYYTYSDTVEGHTFWVAKSLALKGCVGQGDTRDEAVSELATNKEDWLEEAKEFGIHIPQNNSCTVDTIATYLSMPKAMPMNKMASIHQQIAEEIGNDLDAIDLYGELIAAAIKYATIRAKWSVMSREEKMEKDPYRTSLHNDVILQINILARYLRKAEKPASWRDLLGDETADPMCRKVIGDFACYLVFVNGLCAR